MTEVKMSLSDDTETYLRKLRHSLSGLAPAERDDIVNEIRSHLLERHARGEKDLLAGFGAPEDLAASFVAEASMRGALARGTSFALGRALLVGARDSALALLVLFPLVLLHIIALGFVITAAAKPFIPSRAGVWVGPNTFHVGFHSMPDPLVREVLGWWAVPVLAGVGFLLFFIANRALRALVRWRLRMTRPVHV
jgi:uncharacterized membrane protein